MGRKLLVSDRSEWDTRLAGAWHAVFCDFDVVALEYGERAKPEILVKACDWIFSFRSYLVLPHHLITSANRGAVVFHPAPAHFRDGDADDGFTCHQMGDLIAPEFIVEVIRVAIDPPDEGESLCDGSAQACTRLLARFIDRFVAGGQTWGASLQMCAVLEPYFARSGAGSATAPSSA